MQKNPLTSPWAHRFAFLLSLVPIAWLAWRWQHHDLTPNAREYVARYTGDWTMRMLLISLAITPLRRIPGLNPLIGYRRMLGLFAFFYGVLHFLHYVVIDLQFDWLVLQDDLTSRRFFIAGAIALLLMVPLAITSTNGWIRRLGKNWARLHKLVYLSLIVACIHYIWQWKGISIPALYFPGYALILLLARAVLAIQKRWSASKRRRLAALL
jgi:methionine sulfoxide reductase heme-binding subunit